MQLNLRPVRRIESLNKRYESLYWVNHSGIFVCIGGSRGGREGRTPPPGRPNSFDFMQFSGKFGVFTPPLEGSRPPLGKILDPPLVCMFCLNSELLTQSDNDFSYQSWNNDNVLVFLHCILADSQCKVVRCVQRKIHPGHPRCPTRRCHPGVPTVQMHTTCKSKKIHWWFLAEFCRHQGFFTKSWISNFSFWLGLE